MNGTFRRFEILLPLRFNDGSAVPPALIATTLLELEQRFGAVSVETQAVQGMWQHQGQSYRDDLTRVFVDVPEGEPASNSSATLKSPSKSASSSSISG